MASRVRAGSQSHEYRLCRVFATRACGSLAVHGAPVRSARPAMRAADRAVAVKCPSKCPSTSSATACRAVEMELQLFAWKKQQSGSCSGEVEDPTGSKSTTHKLAPLGSGDVDVVVTWGQAPSAPDFDDAWESSAPDLAMASVEASAPELTPRSAWACHCFCAEPSAPDLEVEDQEVGADTQCW
jgi:hypothetical protein